MTTTKSRAETEVASLLSTGALRATQNVTGSKMFMKILTSVALSAVTFHRKLLPEESFHIYKIKGRIFPYIKDSTKCSDSNIFYKLLSSIRDALDKQYISEIMINVYENGDDLNSLLESYTYKYVYNNKEEEDTDKASSKRHDAKYILERLMYFMDVSKMRCNQMKPLPETWDMAIYLRYTDNVPNDYNSIGFDPCDSLPEIKKEIKLRIGYITTPYHQLRIYNHSDVPFETDNMESFKESQENCNRENNTETGKDNITRETAKDLFDNGTLFTDADKNVDNNKKNNKKNERKLTLKNKKAFFECDSVDTAGFRCPCQRNFISSTFSTIKCHSCLRDQHAECFGLLVENINDKFIHTCDECAEENPQLVCSDPELTNKYLSEKKLLCQLRTTLACFNFYREIDVPLLMTVQNVSKRIAKSLLDRAIQLEVFQMRNDHNRANTWIVNHMALQKIIPNFFSKPNPKSSISTKQLEGLTLEDQDEIMCTPNILTNQSVDYSPSKVKGFNEIVVTTALEENLLDVSMESRGSRRSTRVKKTNKRYYESDDESPSRNTRGGCKMFKRNH